MASLRRCTLLARQAGRRALASSEARAPQFLQCRALSEAAKFAARAVPPSKEEAKQLPSHVCELSNDSLYILAESGCHDACSERLSRHIMAADDVEWLAAQEKVKEIDKVDNAVIGLTTLPFKVGVGLGVTSAVVCVPMVFHLGTVEVVNKMFVTTDVPEPADLETAWEVGAWAWNWMEPPLGVASFVLLAMQMTRAQLQNMDIKPYTGWSKKWRGDRLSSHFPQYQADYIKAFAESKPLSGRSK